MKKLIDKKILLCKSDVLIIKSYANHLKNTINPLFPHSRLQTTVILGQLSRSLGYNNFEELKRYCSSVILFTDVHLYLSNIIESALIELLRLSIECNSDSIQKIKNISILIDNSFIYQQYNEYLFDVEPSHSTRAFMLLLPHSSGYYRTIMFSSYVELALELSDLHSVKEPSLSNINSAQFGGNIENRKAIINSNFPVYRYIDSLLPKGSIFVVNQKEKVISHDFVTFSDLPKNVCFGNDYLFQLAFTSPSSFLYEPFSSESIVGFTCINPGYESEIRMTNTPQLKNLFKSYKNGTLVCEAMFRNSRRRPEVHIKHSYKEICDAYIKNFFSNDLPNNV